MSASDINVRVVGEGETTLVMVHGFSCALDDWNSVVPLLSNRYRCVALDLPGHGRSPAPNEATIAALAEAVNTVRRGYGTGRAVLMGHSLGAKIIREACCQDPEGINGLVLIDGALYQGDCAALAETMRAKIDAMGFGAFATQHFANMFGDAFPQPMKDTMVARAAAQPTGFARALYLDAIRFDAQRSLETLGAIKVPMLVLQSTEVALPSGRQSLREGDMTPLMRAVCERTPHGQAVVIPNAGHFTMLDAPDRVALEIDRFVARLA